MTDLVALRIAAIERAQEAALQEVNVRVVEDVAEDDEPVTREQAYDHLRIAFDSSGALNPADDRWLDLWLPAARVFCEQFLGRSLATKTLELTASSFPTVAVSTVAGPSIALPFGPVQSIIAVGYTSDETDSSGTVIVFDDAVDSNGDPLYVVDTTTIPARVVPAYGESWPTARSSVGSVRVRYVAGYVNSPDSAGNEVIPRTARAAILLLLAHWYQNRETTTINNMTEIPFGVQHLLELVPDRERLGMA